MSSFKVGDRVVLKNATCELHKQVFTIVAFEDMVILRGKLGAELAMPMNALKRAPVPNHMRVPRVRHRSSR